MSLDNPISIKLILGIAFNTATASLVLAVIISYHKQSCRQFF